MRQLPDVLGVGGGGLAMNRILIVEDEERIASFIEKGLRANGFTTTVAADGDQAIGLADPASSTC